MFKAVTSIYLLKLIMSLSLFMNILQVFSNRHIKCVIGKVVPKLLAMKNRKLLNETSDKIVEITESDRHVVHYLAGSLIHWIKKKPGITEEKGMVCTVIHEMPLHN